MKKKSVGQSLIKNLKERKSKQFTWINADEYIKPTKKSYNLTSVTEENDLEKLMKKVDVDEKQFLETNDLHFAKDIIRQPTIFNNIVSVCIPHRPKWAKGMDKATFERIEEQTFTEWRRDLAKLEESDNKETDQKFTVPPYEKNLEIWRQLWRVVERSDVVIQIVDARNILFYRSLDLESYVREKAVFNQIQKENTLSQFNKINILLINKSEFLSKNLKLMWRTYFNSRNDTKLINFSDFQKEYADKNMRRELSQKLWKEGQTKTIAIFYSAHIISPLESDDMFLATDLLDLFSCLKLYKDEYFIDNVPHEKDYTDNSDCDENVNSIASLCDIPDLNVGFVGYPNVGKSSTINGILGAKKVAVSATPGKTKHFQTHLIPSIGVCLCDCPGLVMPNFLIDGSKTELILNGVLPIHTITDAINPIMSVVYKVGLKTILPYYNLPIPNKLELLDKLDDRNLCQEAAEYLLTTYSISRGYASTLGQPDYHRSARPILCDYLSGNLLYCHPPSSVKNELKPPMVEHQNVTKPRNTLVTGDKAELQLDSEFFCPKKTSLIESRSMYSSVSTLALNTGLTIKDINPSKKHFNHGKREKIRRVKA